MDIQQHIQTTINQLCEGIHEREQIIAVCLLGTIAGHNTFLYGPPGTAKSLISRRLANAYENPQYFEYLMNRFSTPEEVFGPVSIKALKEDCYTRKIHGYLPTATFAFLDEIWKASPAILNNLLTIINEHIFKNGDERIEVPLKSLIAASNEVPAPNQGLEALYDRFIIRLLVPPIQNENHFKALLNNRPSSDMPNISEPISYELLEKWREELQKVQISEDTFLVIQYIRQHLIEKFEELNIYVSDRRWQRAAVLLKASAFCNGRPKTNHSDAILLKHCLWTMPENREAVETIVMDSIKACGFKTDISLAELDLEKEKIDKEIQLELFHDLDVYDTIDLNGKEYFKAVVKFKRTHYYNSNETQKTIYIPANKIKSTGNFFPVDVNGNEIKDVGCNFDKQGTCTISMCRGNSLDHKDTNYEEVKFSPEILYKKGSKKKNINERLIKALAISVKELREQLIQTLKQIEDKQQYYLQFLESPFVTRADIDVVILSINEQISQLKLRMKDCERLESLCR